VSSWTRRAAEAGPFQIDRRGMMKLPRYSRKRVNCGFPVAVVIAQ
jgi:hypothetical protein